MKRHSPFICLLLTMVCLAAVAPRAGAQDVTPEQVQVALDRTDEQIEKARMVVENSGNETAELELAAAVQLQARAKGAFAAGQYRLALSLTFEARLHVEKAMRIAQGPDPDRVLAQLERTRELLDRARDRIEECENARARALLRVAFEMQARAEIGAREGRFLAALQLTLSARERALRALRLCHLEDNLREAAERALSRTEELIGRARDLVAESANERARNALARSEQLQAEAYAQFRADHFEASLRLTQSARTIAHRAIRLAGGR